MEDNIYKYALQNAVKYDGKTQAKALLGRVLGENPSLRGDVPGALKIIQKVVDKVNKMTLVAQQKDLEKVAPELVVVKKEHKAELKPLKNAERGKVVMRFAPSASGRMHIGHAYTLSVNSEYCRMYNGKFILRIEDTNPEKSDASAYYMEEEAEWITKGNVFKTVIQSDRLGLYYDAAEELIKRGHGYVCTCDGEKFRELKLKMKVCPCRKLSVENNIERYHKMFINYKPGDAVLRLKTDIKDKNPAMRDFPLMRINDSTHPRAGKKHRVWPLMNLSVAVDDHDMGMTHVLRAKDHMDNEKRQRILFKYMDWEPFPETIYVGKIHFEDLRLSTSKTRALIEEGVYSGWDDIRLPFFAALRRRGIRPNAFIKYAKEVGVTENDKHVTQEDFFKGLYAFNRDVIDKDANRYFFVEEPKKIKISGGVGKEVEMLVHPDFPKRGKRRFTVKDEFYITAEDFDSLDSGRVYRLMDAYNFVKKGGKLVYHSDLYTEWKEKAKGGKIIHWLPVQDDLVSVEVLMPDATRRIGYAEPKVRKLLVDNVVQFERFGFVRCDLVSKDKIEFWFAHR